MPTLKEFRAKERLAVDLLSDVKRVVSRRYGTLHEDTFFSNRAYVLVDTGGVPRWSHVEDTPGQGRDDAELLEAIHRLQWRLAATPPRP